ncbi:MAG TPA: hypothetical protein VGS22_04560 [Thermoanaerobaculia bacterium]|jgi:hypothetical protein|nr:hypothetical protein [Thermoanaerobaculia bacterium]
MDLMRRMLATFLVVVGTIALADSRTPASAISESKDSACRRVELEDAPDWIISGAFSPSGEALFLVDHHNQAILRYNDSGRAFGPLSIGERLTSFRPSMLKSYGDGFVLEMAAGRYALFDKNFAPLQTRDALREAGRVNPTLLSFFLWDVAGEDLIAFSDFSEGPSNVERTGFVRLPIRSAEPISILNAYSPKDPIRNFNRLGHPYITSIGTTAYFLEMTSPPRLIRSRGRTREWAPLNVTFPGGSPNLPEFWNRTDIPAVMEAVSKSSMPVGLYRSGKSLIVLSRQKDPGRSTTTWLLTRINPEREQVLWTKRIDLSAEHVVAVPGPINWAFVEKGSVEAMGVQKSRSILFVPTSRIDNEAGGSPICP